MKETEQQFLCAIYNNGHPLSGRAIREACNTTGNYKQNWYYLQKWCDKQWYDYGVTLDLGWMTPEGIAAAQQGGQQA